MLFPFLSSLSTTLILLAAFTLVRGPLQYAVLLLSGVTAVAFVPPAVSVTQDVVHPGLRAVSLSTNVVIQHVLGSALGPPVVGAFSDAFGIETALSGDEVQVRVSDTGTGIPAEIMEKIFEPYFTTKPFGTGLGLTIVFKIVKEHFGDIAVASREGEGTTFTITLPVPQKDTMLLEDRREAR